MNLLNREFQMAVLTTLADSYSNRVDVADLPRGEGNSVVVNLTYLEEHRLLDVMWSSDLSLAYPEADSARINNRGIDFLKGDGGLGAILGVVTIKLHQDTVRELLLARIDESADDPGAKEILKRQIRALPATLMQRLAEAAIDAGLRQLPNAVAWTQRVIAQLDP